MIPVFKMANRKEVNLAHCAHLRDYGDDRKQTNFSERICYCYVDCLEYNMYSPIFSKKNGIIHHLFNNGHVDRQRRVQCTGLPGASFPKSRIF